MLIPWSVGMKSKDVWLRDPAREMEEKKIKQQANQRVDQNNPDGWPSYYKDWEHWKKRQQKWAKSTHEWCGRLCNTSQHTQRGLLLVSHLFHIQTSLEVGSRREAMHAVETEDGRNQFGGKQPPNRYCQEIEPPGVTTGGSIYGFSEWQAQWEAMWAATLGWSTKS